MKISKILIQAIAVAVTMGATEIQAQQVQQKEVTSSNKPKIKKKSIPIEKVADAKKTFKRLKNNHIFALLAVKDSNNRNSARNQFYQSRVKY